MILKCYLLVEQLHGALEASELHHGVGDLSHPQGNQTLVEGIDALILQHLGHSLAEVVGESGNGLDLDLGGLERRQGDIGEELGRSGSSQIQRGAVEVGILLTNDIGVLHFEQLVQTELAQTL